MKTKQEEAWMYFREFLAAIDDILALIGLTCILAGVYLWFGIPPALILLGTVLVFIGWRLPAKVVHHEPD